MIVARRAWVTGGFVLRRHFLRKVSLGWHSIRAALIMLATEAWVVARSRPRTSAGQAAAPAETVRRARALRKGGKPDLALAETEQGLASHPGDLGLMLEQAEAFHTLEWWVRAALAWGRVLRHAGGNAPARVYSGLAEALRRLKRLRLAEAVLARGQRQHPEDYAIAAERAWLSMVREDWRAAIAGWEAALPLWLFHHRPGDALYFRQMCSLLDAHEKTGRHPERPRGAAPSRFGGLRVGLFTAVAGQYDSIKVQTAVPDDIDCVLFADRPVPAYGFAEIRPMMWVDADPSRSARFVKTHPHLLMADYDIAIWVDGSVLVEGDPGGLVLRLLDSGRALGAVPHPHRRTLREELETCIRLGKDDPETMRLQVARQEAEGVAPSDLIESGLLLFDLRDPNLRPMLEDWWHRIETGSRRDQLSLPMALGRSGLPWLRLTEPPDSLRSHPLFALVSHRAGRRLGREFARAYRVKTVDPYAGPSFAQVRDARISAWRDQAVDIVVCVHNAPEAVRACLSSIASCRDNARQNLVLIDDGSAAETAAFLKGFAAAHDWVRLRRNAVSRGYCRAANQGLADTSAPFVILLNSDTVVASSWAEKLADAVFATAGVGIAGPLSNAASHQSIPQHVGKPGQTAVNALPPGHSVDDLNRLCETWTVQGMLPRVPLVHGFCLGIRRDVIDRIGGFDEALFPRGYGEENDFCFRAADAGFGLVIATHTFVYHAKSQSYGSKERKALMAAGMRALVERHGRARVTRSARSMDAHPILAGFRKRAAALF